MYPSVIFVIHGTMISRHCVKRDVGIGSNSHVLLEEPINYFKISSFDTGLNVWRAVPVNCSYDGVKTPNESSSLRTFTFYHWKMLQIFHICHSQFQKVKVLLFLGPGDGQWPRTVPCWKIYFQTFEENIHVLFLGDGVDFVTMAHENVTMNGKSGIPPFPFCISEYFILSKQHIRISLMTVLWLSNCIYSHIVEQ